MAAELKVDEATLAHQEAQTSLEAARLYAPFAGTVMDIPVNAGDQVATSTTILTLADLQDRLLRFWLDESDMSRVAVGNQVNVLFDALPESIFSGTVVRVDPVLVRVSGTSAVQAQAQLLVDDTYDDTLLAGMTADVEVIAAEARDALLIPVEALREQQEGGYVVSVVTADGEVIERDVEPGLKGTLNAEILSGLQLGETVRIGDSR
jgi:macrolide-specific efflux system membrane fusion protein